MSSRSGCSGILSTVVILLHELLFYRCKKESRIVMPINQVLSMLRGAEYHGDPADRLVILLV